MTTHLREELAALADTQSFSPDPSAWDRGRRVRRRDRVVRGAAIVAVVAAVVGIGSLATRPDAVGPAGSGEHEAAIPSVVPEPDGATLTDLAIGRASVAYVDERRAGMPVLVDASTGEARWADLPDFPELPGATMDDWFHGPWLALTPDGRHLAYPAGSWVERTPGRRSITTPWYRVVDLETGAASLVEVPPGTGTPRAISWTDDGRLSVDVQGPPTAKDQEPPIETWTIDPVTGDSLRSVLTGVLGPGVGVRPEEAAGGGISAPYPLDDERVRSVPFETDDGSDPTRALPADLYPDGAVVTPVGWAEDRLLVARVDAPAGSSVEGEHLVLMTSADIPESEWTYRILVEDVPDAPSLSIAVDLIPDLDGTSSQELTHDFGEVSGDDEGRGALPSALGGLMALLAGLAYIRMLQKQA